MAAVGLMVSTPAMSPGLVSLDGCCRFVPRSPKSTLTTQVWVAVVVLHRVHWAD